jgi:peptide/nickel transport system substrate-binding protein/oligopeptide transport system substrate-binding protein
MPNLLQLLAQPEHWLVHDRTSSGPMTMVRHGDIAVLQPIDPKVLGLPAIRNWRRRIRILRLVAVPAKQAVLRFNESQADLVLGGSIEDFPLANSVGILRGSIQLDPVMGLFGLSVEDADGFLATPENREAIAMAIDRDALIANFGLSGWTPTTRIIAPGVEDGAGRLPERWSAMSMDQRRAAAKARVARWLSSQTEKPAPLRIYLPQGAGSDMLFHHLQQDLGAIGLETVRAESEKQADLRLVDDVARYPRSEWFLNRLSCKIGHSLCSDGAEDAMDQAREASDPLAYAALLAQAEQQITADNVFIPFGEPIRWSLARGDAAGFASNRWGWHPLMPMALLPK